MARKAPGGKKHQAVEMLAAGGFSQVQVAEAVGVHHKTVARWQRDPEFCAQVLERSRELIKKSLPEIYIALLEQAKKGSHQHIRMVLEHLERLEGMQQTAAEGHISFTWKPKDPE